MIKFASACNLLMSGIRDTREEGCHRLRKKLTGELSILLPAMAELDFRGPKVDYGNEET